MPGHSPKGRRPSMADVGRHARVSAQTVSRYFTGGYVSEDTRRRVEIAIAELGYSRNRLPRSLRRDRTDMIGFLSVGPINYGSGSLLTGISRAAQAANKALLTTRLDPGRDAENLRKLLDQAIETFLSLRVDGIVIGSPYRGMEEAMRQVPETVPVMVAAELTDDFADSVCTDSYGAAQLAVHHLTDRGHSKIVHLAGPKSTNEAIERLRGYQEAMNELGLAPMPPVHASDWTAKAAIQAIKDYDLGDATAVFASNDQLALAFIKEMSARGLRCPMDYSIVGVDDSPDAAYYSPSLTTVRLDFELMGEVAFSSLIDRLQTGERQPHRTIGAELVIRDSTDVPPH